MEWQHLPLPLLSSILCPFLCIVRSLHSYIHACGWSLIFSCSAADGVTEGCILRVLHLTGVNGRPRHRVNSKYHSECQPVRLSGGFYQMNEKKEISLLNFICIIIGQQWCLDAGNQLCPLQDGSSRCDQNSPTGACFCDVPGYTGQLCNQRKYTLILG